MKFKGFFTILALTLFFGDIPIVPANEERDVLSIKTTTELIQVLKELQMEVQTNRQEIRSIKETLIKCDMCKATTPACPEVTTDTSTATNTSPPPDMATTTFGPPDKSNYRLPRHISPILYTLRIIPIIEGEFIASPSVYMFNVRDHGNFSIFGDIKIDMVCSENTKNIVLHINDIDVHEETIQVSGEGLEGILVHHTSFDKITQFFTIYLSDELKAGMQLSLTMSYLAKLNRLGGFYRSSYFDEPYNISSIYYDNMDIQSLRHIAATQFQPTDARRAFPCFDEPNFKARFAITLGRKKNMTSLSNMPVNRTVPHQSMPDYEWDIYEESAPMSTYLVVFVISDFVKNIAPNTGETEVTVWSRPGTEEQTRYAISIASKVLEYFEEFFQIPYPLQKHDMIAIPDVGPRATDNYGSIIYSERAVLYDPDFSSEKNKQQVAVAIAYKLARQWIDNSQITSDWWDFLWLNEGLAIYLEFKGVGWVEPDMKMEQKYLNDAIHHAMQLDESAV
ncbi:aminopeptidase N-like isoform X2 [Artemia franciscana]